MYHAYAMLIPCIHLVTTHPGQVVLGLGFATLTPLRGGAAIIIAAAGARLAGVLVQALPSYHPLSSATITTSHYLPVPLLPTYTLLVCSCRRGLNPTPNMLVQAGPLRSRALVQVG